MLRIQMKSTTMNETVRDADPPALEASANSAVHRRAVRRTSVNASEAVNIRPKSKEDPSILRHPEYLFSSFLFQIEPPHASHSFGPLVEGPGSVHTDQIACECLQKRVQRLQPTIRQGAQELEALVKLGKSNAS